MMAEVLLDSIDQTLGTTTSFNEIAFLSGTTHRRQISTRKEPRDPTLRCGGEILLSQDLWKKPKRNHLRM